MLKLLPNHVTTDYAITVQHDGFAVNNGYWLDDYLKYDYIGAPWINKGGFQYRVGNGGFSLRSKKLIQACADNMVQRQPDKKHGHNEDKVICEYFRSYLTNTYKLNYAPLHIAKLFSYEKGKAKTQLHTFGFHGPWNIPLVCNEVDAIDFVKETNWINKQGLLAKFKKNCDRVKYKECSKYIAKLQNTLRD